MADGKETSDPLAVWRDMLSQWEQNVNALANRAMGSDEYSSSINGAMAASLKLQETMRQFMAAYLAHANLPSRTEVTAIAERLGGVEARLDRITALLERIAAAPTGDAPAASAGASPNAPPRPRPARTKKPPSPPPERADRPS
ncbi:MAG TPA: poly(R)-hydroxyalkanoic acid synthase subunit PhaE [Candidatus Elarobacter sp.]|nr:poly(R)-hydroxyalkanoic acid synthase subunit PhaE [Candidatus Elarobacter sp.]